MSHSYIDVQLDDYRATEALGATLARAFSSASTRTTAGGAGVVGQDGNGAVIHLCGDLGAGKTTCVRGLLRAFGFTGLVRSPTYTLVETYVVQGMTCLHVDLYRLQGAVEAEELGLRDHARSGSLLLIEWPEKGGSTLLPADLELMFEYAGNARRVSLEACTAQGRDWLHYLAHDASLLPYVSNLT